MNQNEYTESRSKITYTHMHIQTLFTLLHHSLFNKTTTNDKECSRTMYTVVKAKNDVKERENSLCVCVRLPLVLNILHGLCNFILLSQHLLSEYMKICTIDEMIDTSHSQSQSHTYTHIRHLKYAPFFAKKKEEENNNNRIMDESEEKTHQNSYDGLQTQIENRKQKIRLKLLILIPIATINTKINSMNKTTVMVLNLISQLTYKMSSKMVDICSFIRLFVSFFCCCCFLLQSRNFCQNENMTIYQFGLLLLL